MKKNLLILSISFLCINTFIVAQEPLKETAAKTAEQMERKDTTKLESQQEPAKRKAHQQKRKLNPKVKTKWRSTSKV